MNLINNLGTDANVTFRIISSDPEGFDTVLGCEGCYWAHGEIREISFVSEESLHKGDRVILEFKMILEFDNQTKTSSGEIAVRVK